MKEMFADMHVHIGRSEKGKPIKITAARSLNFANIAKECADRKGIQIVGIIDCASPYVIEDIEEFLKNGDAYEIEDGGIIYKNKVCIILGSELETSEVNDDGKTGSAHNLCYFSFGSPSTWREWIEIRSWVSSCSVVGSPSTWREWIEMSNESKNFPPDMSPSTWREWIEISLLCKCDFGERVSLHLEGVD